MNKNKIVFCMTMFISVISQVGAASNANTLQPVEREFVFCLTHLKLDLVPAATMSDAEIMALPYPTSSASTAQSITPEYWEMLKTQLITTRATDFMKEQLKGIKQGVERAQQCEQEANKILTRAQLIARARAMRRR